MRGVRLRVCKVAGNTNYYQSIICVPLLACLAVRVTSHPGVARNTSGQANSAGNCIDIASWVACPRFYVGMIGHSNIPGPCPPKY